MLLMHTSSVGDANQVVNHVDAFWHTYILEHDCRAKAPQHFGD